MFDHSFASLSMTNVLAVPAFIDNYIWLICNENSPKQAAIIDPGEAGSVIDALTELSITPVAIMLTHHHDRHTGGVEELLKRYKIPVYGPAIEQERMPGITHPMCDGDYISLPFDKLSFTVMAVPGHTRGHIAYYGHHMLFCGDTLFGAGCGRLFEGTALQMYESLKKIAALPKNTLVYCAHEYTLANLKFAMKVEPGNADIRTRLFEAKRSWAHGQPTVPSTLELELRTNPFLRCRTGNVIVAAENFAERRLTTQQDVFAVLRYWKDTLDDSGV